MRFGSRSNQRKQIADIVSKAKKPLCGMLAVPKLETDDIFQHWSLTDSSSKVRTRNSMALSRSRGVRFASEKSS